MGDTANLFKKSVKENWSWEDLDGEIVTITLVEPTESDIAEGYTKTKVYAVDALVNVYLLEEIELSQ